MSIAMRVARWGMVAVLGIAGFGAAHLQAQEQKRPAVGTGVAHIRSISPRSGTAGTEIWVEAQGLPMNTSVYIALAALESGYEVLQTTKTDDEGDLVAKVKVPEAHLGHWDHTEVVLVLSEDRSEVLATSDPFHITNAEGFVKRQGIVQVVRPGCAALQDFDGNQYALVGRSAMDLVVSAGRFVSVEGPIADGTCGLQNAIDVRRVVLPPVR